jgi:hypothetical protein
LLLLYISLSSSVFRNSNPGLISYFKDTHWMVYLSSTSNLLSSLQTFLSSLKFNIIAFVLLS